MKALTRYFAAALLVAVLSFEGLARADSPGQMIDEKNAEQDAALKERAEIDKAIGAQIIVLKEEDARLESELAAEAALNAAQADSLKSLAASVESLEARVKALEEVGPVEPPEPPIDPEPSMALYLIGPDGLKGPEILSDLTVEGKFSVCAYAEDGVEGRVRFLRDGVEQRNEGNSAYCLFGGDTEAFPTGEWAPGEYALTVTSSNLPERTIQVKVNGAQPPPIDPDPIDPPTGDAHALMQIGPWGWQYSIEEPFIDMMHATSLFWEGCGTNTSGLLERGIISSKTGLPMSTPGCALNTGVFFPPHLSQYANGKWIIECDGVANLHNRFIPNDLQEQTGPGRLEFTHNERTGDHMPVIVSNMTQRCKSLRLYRAENEAALKSGKLYSPKFIDAVAKYDIIRTMDLQSANPAVIRSVDDLPSMEASQWLTKDWENPFSNPFQGMPIEAVFRLGVEAGKPIWFQAPITLGAPQPLHDFRPDSGRIDLWAQAFGESAGKQAWDVIESEEWDRYADAFVEGLIKSGYPEDRIVYASLANEVWNWAGHYFLTTKYAERMGNGMRVKPGFETAWTRDAYGALLGRFKLAVDAALERAGRDQAIEYVIEGQAADPGTTIGALKGLKAFLEHKGENWNDHKGSFGVSISSYWGWDRPAAHGVDADDLPALEDWLINGPASDAGTLANVVDLWKRHQTEGAKYGVKLLGAYEGGPHFGRPWRGGPNGERVYEMTQANYQEFVWGERGANVNYQVNKALAEAFPGVILSNYALAGTTGGQPWFEGPIGVDNPYANSWDKLIEELGQ